ncbi:MAG: hypothetical protein M1819_002851 [Sarea resinae]|nr:MAG: hypothetical protein M1819_002851 [Sarea resinae]
MKDGGCSEEFPLPSIISHLAPYIKTRQETLNIRRALTAHFHSILPDHEVDKGHSLALFLSNGLTELPALPSGICLLRKEYIKSLRAHIRASNEYEHLTARSTAESDQGRQIPHTDGTSTYASERGTVQETTSTYIGLLRQRQRYQRLLILQDYLDVLQQKPAAKPQYLEVGELSRPLDSMPSLPPPICNRNERSTAEVSEQGEVDALLLRLERNVIQAKNLLERQKILLTALQLERERLKPPKSGRAKCYALQRTRTELISWLEAELGKAGEKVGEKGICEGSAENFGVGGDLDSTLDSPEQTAKVKDLYDIYVQARKSLLLILATEPTNVATWLDSSQILDSPNCCPSKEKDRNAAPTEIDLSCLREHLLPIAMQQRSIAQQRSHITATIAKEQESTVRAIDRLSDESHLLPTYPLLAGKARFKNATKALSSRPSVKEHVQLEPPLGSPSISGTVQQANAWAFASEAASSAAEEVIEKIVRGGEDRINSAQKTLDELQSLLGQGTGEQNFDSTEVNEPEDIWAPKAATGMKRKGHTNQHRHRLGRADDSKIATGIFKDLSGDINVLG